MCTLFLGAKVTMTQTHLVPVNHHITEMMEELKPKLRELVQYSGKIKMWIKYSIPKVEDGNNFGVQIQEDILSETKNVESDVSAYLDQIAGYFASRGRYVSKIGKYPHVEDYRRTVREIDERQFVNLRLVILDLRNHYGTLHDIITKNMEKIKKPRSSNADNLY